MSEDAIKMGSLFDALRKNVDSMIAAEYERGFAAGRASERYREMLDHFGRDE